MLKIFIRVLTVTGLALLFFSIDRWTKNWAEQQLLASDQQLWGDVIRFKLEHNANLALSIPFPLGAQLVLSFILLIALIWYFGWAQRPQHKWEIFVIAMIFGGALGNLADRLLFGRVTDFIAVWHFPVFNLADVFLFFGVAFFLIRELRKQPASAS